MKYQQKYVSRHQAALLLELVLVLERQKVISYNVNRYIYVKAKPQQYFLNEGEYVLQVQKVYVVSMILMVSVYANFELGRAGNRVSSYP